MCAYKPAALHSFAVQPPAAQPTAVQRLRTNPTLTKPKVLYACSALLSSRRFASTAYGCAAACAQKLRFCCKPYGLPANRRFASEAEQASKGFAAQRSCASKSTGYFSEAKVSLATSRSHFVTSWICKRSCARIRFCKAYAPLTANWAYNN